METKHVILRSLERRDLSVDRGPTLKPGSSISTGIPSSPVAIEFEQLTPQRAADVARKKGVEAVAPVIRMKLIEPVAVAPSPAAASARDSAWGIGAVGANKCDYDGKEVIVAVLDTGIDAKHPAFDGVNVIRKNFTNESDEDLHGHGTHCAGTIFGRPVEGTHIGIAPGVKAALIGKVLSSEGGGSDVLLAAIEWALQNGAHVISMSLGIDFPGFVADLVKEGMPTELATSKALEGYRANVRLFERLAALIQARSAFMQPCLIVAAAGNESQRPRFEIAVSPPAVADGIVSVAAVRCTPDGYTVAPFSNVGARVAAPGVEVLSAKRGGGLCLMSGTSMAAPHVAGVAALWAEKLRADSQFTGTLLTDKLMGSATMDGVQPGYDPAHFGAGIVRAPQKKQ